MPELPSTALIPRNGHSPVPAPVSPAEGGLDWQRYLTAVVRYRWWIAAATVLGILGGIGASKVLPPRYFVQATIWIQSGDSRGPDRGQPIGANHLLAASAWTDLMRSYVVLDAVVRDRRLYLQARQRDQAALGTFSVADRFQPGRYRMQVDKAGASYTLEDAEGATVEQGKVGAPVGRTLGFVWTPTPADLPPGADIQFRVTTLRDAAKSLIDQLRITTDPSGNFLRISLTGPSATAAANILNALADRYVAVATDLKRAKLTELTGLLGEQLQAAEANMHRAERALEDFRVRTITLPSDLAGPGGAAVGARASSVNDFFELRIEQDQLARDQQALANALAQLRDASGSAEGLATIGAVQRSPDLAQALRELTTKRAEQRALAYRYTPEHPTLRRVTGEIEQLERRTIPDLARTLEAELAARQRVLGQQIASGGRELRAIPQRAIEEARLRRDVSIAENLFTAVQQRHSEARLAEASSIADVRLLDAAVAPQTPVRDTGARLLVLGLLAGLGFGVVGAVLVDRFDPRVRYPDQVTGGMGLRILGALPHVKHKDAGPDDEQVLQVIETMRSLRLSLMHAYGSAGPLVVTVTSPAVGDGKSFVSTNLALACAQAGQRTLLLDGDTRRGSLHRVLQAMRKPGLTDYLAGRASLDTVTQSVRFPSLHFIGAGSRLRESPELLGSPQMIDLLVKLRQQYQVIIVDSPPLGAGVDAYTLGTLTGALILVLRTGSTNLALTRTRLTMLEQLPIRLLGVLLNDVQRGDLYGYYNYNYFPGYGAVDEDHGAKITRERMRVATADRGKAREWSRG
ncbi:MAG TPA: polysaccharide biosynthesis tyrosine autokinase [Gemmatimonadales bacterium]|nr:polysaccharide biosynthesis tyrosine autokinase [Gemmatimonadales bacterium]